MSWYSAFVPYAVVSFSLSVIQNLNKIHTEMTIISKIKKSHESSEHQLVHLLLKFLAQVQFNLNRVKEISKQGRS